MSVAPVNHGLSSTLQAVQAARTPHKRDHDGDNNKVESKAPEASEAAKGGGQTLNIKA